MKSLLNAYAKYESHSSFVLGFESGSFKSFSTNSIKKSCFRQRYKFRYGKYVIRLISSLRRLKSRSSLFISVNLLKFAKRYFAFVKLTVFSVEVRELGKIELSFLLLDFAFVSHFGFTSVFVFSSPFGNNQKQNGKTVAVLQKINIQSVTHNVKYAT